MKQNWDKFVARTDAMSMRERVLVFAVAVILLALLMQTTLIEPLFNKQKMLTQGIAEQKNKIVGINAEIVQKLRAFDLDPDRADRDRLQTLKQQSQQLTAEFRSMEKGLVAPDKVALLLESILRANGRLRLQSMKTIRPSSLSEVAAAAKGQPAPASVPAAPAKAASASSLIYRHGVDIVMRGGYLDLLDYLKALEAKNPGQLYWGNAKLSVDAYPSASLALSVYTMSMDQKWMKL